MVKVHFAQVTKFKELAVVDFSSAGGIEFLNKGLYFKVADLHVSLWKALSECVAIYVPSFGLIQTIEVILQTLNIIWEHLFAHVLQRGIFELRLYYLVHTL